MFAPIQKTAGLKSAIPRERWEKALYEYRFLDKSARTLGAELERDHSTVIRMFQGMERKEPGILARLQALHSTPVKEARNQ